MQCPPGSFGAGRNAPPSGSGGGGGAGSGSGAPCPCEPIRLNFSNPLAPSQNSEVTVFSCKGKPHVGVHGTFTHPNLTELDVTLRLYAESKGVRSLVACVTIPRGGNQTPTPLIEYSGTAESWLLTASWREVVSILGVTSLPPTLTATLIAQEGDAPYGLSQSYRGLGFQQGRAIAKQVPPQWRWGSLLLGSADLDSALFNNGQRYVQHDGQTFLRRLAVTLTSANARWIHIVSSAHAASFIHSRLCQPSGGEVQWDFTDPHHKGAIRDGLWMRDGGMVRVIVSTSATNPALVDALATGFVIGEVA